MEKQKAKQMKQVLSSSILRELKQQYSDAPEEITVRVNACIEMAFVNFGCAQLHYFYMVLFFRILLENIKELKTNMTKRDKSKLSMFIKRLLLSSAESNLRNVKQAVNIGRPRNFVIWVQVAAYDFSFYLYRYEEKYFVRKVLSKKERVRKLEVFF